jgi:hypothetical protein
MDSVAVAENAWLGKLTLVRETHARDSRPDVIPRTNLILDHVHSLGIVENRQPQACVMVGTRRRKSLSKRIGKGWLIAAAAMAVLGSAAQAQQVTITSDDPLPVSEHCLGSEALQAAKALYLHHYDFAVGDPAKSEGLLDPRLSDRLAQNFACEKDGVCALETDTWTGAQDGAVAEPITISFMDDGSSTSVTDVKVRFAFAFQLEGQKPVPESAILEFTRDGDGQCWKLLDMTSATGDSLLQQLIDYQANP